MSATVVLIDLSSVAHPLHHVHQNDADANSTSTHIIEAVRRYAAGQPHVAICCDSGRSFRKDISGDYKAQRGERDPALYVQIARALDVLRADGFPVWAASGFEADDLIASATRHCLLPWAEGQAFPPGGCEVLIISSDKDLLQLVGPRVTAKSVASGAVLTVDGVIEKFGVAPDRMGDYLALVGDASDNITGAKGIGPKRASELIAKFGSLDELYADFDAATATERAALGFTPAICASLTEFRGRRAEVQSLIALRTDVPIPLGEVFVERVAAPIEPEADHGFGVEAPDDDMTITLSDPIIEGTIVPDSPQTSAAPMPTPASSALTVAAPQGLVPRNLDEAFRLAKALFLSRQFGAYGNPEAVMATLLAGHELGLQPMAALRSIHIIEGKPTLSADLIRAKAMQHPACRFFRCTERTETRSTFETQRGDDPQVSLSFTIEEGRSAWKKDDVAWRKSGWGTFPADMLVARASAKLARLVYPEACFGLYTADELTDGRP